MPTYTTGWKNRRNRYQPPGGFHYFCSSPTLSNRGNSYFIYSWVDNDKVQLYKVTGNVYTMVAEVSYDFTAGQWYDHKVIYDRITGKHLVYIENALVLKSTDSSPLTSGNYISFRSAECQYSVNNFRTFRSRAGAATVTVSATGDLRYLNPSPGVPAGSVKSICIDNRGQYLLRGRRQRKRKRIFRRCRRTRRVGGRRSASASPADFPESVYGHREHPFGTTGRQCRSAATRHGRAAGIHANTYR